MDTTQVTRAGFSLTEIMVVMILTGLIVGLLLPNLHGYGDRESRRASCCNNQRQIVLGMAVYANDNDQKWPVFTANHAGHWVPLEDQLFDPTATAIGSLELLSYVTGGDLAPKLFSCISKPIARPSSPADTNGASTSVSVWAAHGPAHIGYAYDWSTPPDACSVRVVTGDRDQQAHKGSVVMAAFADGHAGVINRVASTFINRDANNDDLYTAVGDGRMDTPGMGSTTRAYLR